MSQKEASWIRVQEKAFTQWLNDTVKARNMEVKDLRTDLKDGLCLIAFFELLAGHNVSTRYERKPTQRIHMITNLAIALRFMESDLKIRNPGCSAEDIVDAELHGIKLILGMLWVLYRKFRMAVAGDKKKGKEEDQLLEWVRGVLVEKGYDDVAEHVQSFRTSFNDGSVFLALAKAYDGAEGNLDYETLKDADVKERLEAAFSFAESEMNVNKLLEVDEVAECQMDERAMALYTSLFYHAFRSKAEREQMQENATASAEELALQKKGKEELIKMNTALTHELEEVRKELEELRAKCEVQEQQITEQQAKIEELEEKLRQKDAELAETKQKVAQLEDANALELGKRQTAEEQVRVLESQNETLQVQCDAEAEKVAEAEAKIAELEKKLAAAEEALKIEHEAKEGGERELMEKLIAEKEKNKALEEQNAQHVETTEKLDEEVKELKKRAKREQKHAEEQEEVISELQSQSKVNTNGLAVLRTNLDAHISDLKRWQKYLEGSVVDVDDPVDEIEELRTQLDGASFQEQLNIISSALQEESMDMARILKERQQEMEGKSSVPKIRTRAESVTEVALEGGRQRSLSVTDPGKEKRKPRKKVAVKK